METEYKKDFRHNYVVLTAEDRDTTQEYSIKMLEHRTIEGFLPMERRRMDKKIMYYYKITAKQSMSVLLDKAALSCDKLRQLCLCIFNTIDNAYEYLLSENDFILSPDYIFMDVITNTPSLCYYPGYQQNIKDQMNSFMEYLLNKVDYNDKEAVLVVYQLYAVSREDGFTFSQYMNVLQGETDKIDSCREDRQNIKPSLDNTEIEKAFSQETGETFRPISQKDIKQKKEQLQQKMIKASEETDNWKATDVRRETNPRKVTSKINETFQKSETDWNSKPENRLLFHKKSDANEESSMNHATVMIEKMEGEKEVSCYPLKILIYAGLSILGGIIIIILSLTTGILYNSFGNRIDYSRLSVLLLILLCTEGYLLKRFLDKKNRITKMVKTCEYLDPRTNLPQPSNFPDKNKKADDSLLLTSKEREVAPLREKNRKVLVKEETNKKQTNTEQEKEEEDYNPTCILNASAERMDKIILKPLDEAQYKNISVTGFPFFIGKFSKSVDYCLDKDVISRIHAKLTKEGEQYYITDLNSTNGTFVNSKALITYQVQEIKYGDEIAFADIRYLFTKAG